MSERGTEYEGTAPPAGPSAPQGERRVALVIGNSAYNEAVGELRNPINDARAFAEKLSLPAFGFDVTLLTNLDRSQFVRSLDTFARAADGADALIYFAGHGAAALGNNMLIPVDFTYDPGLSKNLLRHEILARGVSLAQLLTATSQALRVVVFLDACRNDPSRAIGGASSGDFRSLLSEGFRDAGMRTQYPQRLVARIVLCHATRSEDSINTATSTLKSGKALRYSPTADRMSACPPRMSSSVTWTT